MIYVVLACGLCNAACRVSIWVMAVRADQRRGGYNSSTNETTQSHVGGTEAPEGCAPGAVGGGTSPSPPGLHLGHWAGVVNPHRGPQCV